MLVKGMGMWNALLLYGLGSGRYSEVAYWIGCWLDKHHQSHYHEVSPLDRLHHRRKPINPLAKLQNKKRKILKHHLGISERFWIKKRIAKKSQVAHDNAC